MPAGSPGATVQPLSAAALQAALVRPGSLWREVRVAAETGSTNSDLLSAAADGAPEGLVLAAESQRNGRGRQGRSWVSVAGTALQFSVLLRPGPVPPAAHGWLPLLAGTAVATAVRRVAALDARVKWPNDVLVRDGKLAGLLAEQLPGAVVLGIGINVQARRGDLPVPPATSLALEGAGHVDRAELLIAVLADLEAGYRDWIAAGGAAAAIRGRYLALSATVGRPVRVSLPGGRLLEGTATGIDESGRLLVRTSSGVTPVSAGDVTHVR